MRRLIMMTAALALAVSGTGTAAALEAIQLKELKQERREHRRHHGHPLAASVHRAMYMQLLAERYAPETGPAWKKVFAERAEIMKELHDLQQARKWDAKAIHERMKQWKKNRADDAAIKQRKETAKEFAQAVAQADERRIRAVLPKLLEDEQRANAALRAWLDELKKTKK